LTTWRKKPVRLIIADAGPLISLACADELHLLQAFGQPVAISDVARQECTRKVGAPGEERLSRWFAEGGGNQFKEIDTPMLPAFRDAMKRVADGSDLFAAIGLGDATISWMLKNLTRLKTSDGQFVGIESDDVALILTEDAEFGDGPALMNRRAHVLSTRQFLLMLERLGAIPSYMHIIAEIEAGGRAPPRYMVDRPAIAGAGMRSDWKNKVEETVTLWAQNSMGDPSTDEDGSGNGASGGPKKSRR
jgi:hypothetical protein